MLWGGLASGLGLWVFKKQQQILGGEAQRALVVVFVLFLFCFRRAQVLDLKEKIGLTPDTGWVSSGHRMG